MSKEKRSALIRFLLSVLAVVVGTAILGSMAGGGEGEFGSRGEFGRMRPPQNGAVTAPPAETGGQSQ